jgi:FkbM family methyltransferase
MVARNTEETTKMINGFKWIIKKHLWRRIRPRTEFARMKVQGDTMVVNLSRLTDPDDNFLFSIWAFGEYDPETTKWLTENIKRGDTVIDVGAAFGYYTLLLARLVGPDGIVAAFEPNPMSFAILKENVENSGYQDRVVLYNMAASDTTGTAKFFINSKWAGLSSLLPQPWTSKVIEVDTVRIDDIGLLPPITFVKIDCEGGDALVLRGMRETITKNPDIRIVVEFNPIDYGKAYGFDVLGELEDFEMSHMDALNMLCWRKDNLELGR